MRIVRGFYYLLIIILPFALTTLIPFGSRFFVNNSYMCGKPIGSPFIYSAVMDCPPDMLCPACIEPIHFIPLFLDLIIWYVIIIAINLYGKRRLKTKNL